MMSDGPAGTTKKPAMPTASAIQIRRCLWKCLIRNPTRAFAALTAHARAPRSAGDGSFVRILPCGNNSECDQELNAHGRYRGVKHGRGNGSGGQGAPASVRSLGLGRYTDAEALPRPVARRG